MMYSSNKSKVAPQVTPRTYEEYKAAQKQRIANRKQDMDQEAFMKLLIEQMKNQDPLNPMDNSQFTQQTTMFSQLSEMTAMNKTLESILKTQESKDIGTESLLKSASMIGKIIEYDANTVRVTANGASNITFYSSDASTNVVINLYNDKGQFVAKIKQDSIKKGANSIEWKGIADGGMEVPEGIYYFKVEGKDLSGNDLAIGTYGEGVVKGIRVSNGKMFFEVNNGLVAADDVYYIKEKPEVSDGKDKEDNKTKDDK